MVVKMAEPDKYNEKAAGREWLGMYGLPVI